MNIRYIRYKGMCSYCGDCDHTDRECPIEKKVAPFIRKGIGRPFEFLNERYFKCPFCDSSLNVIDTNIPSCDIECSNSKCSFFAEVKSKCLSCKYLPDDIEMLHGNYDEYIKKRDKGLNLIMIIYKVNRRFKKVVIREVRYISNFELTSNNNVSVIKNKSLKSKKSNSIIKIDDRNLLRKWNIYYQKEYSFMDFLLKCMKDADCTKKEIDKIKNYQTNMEKSIIVDINDKENKMK